MDRQKRRKKGVKSPYNENLGDVKIYKEPEKRDEAKS